MNKLLEIKALEKTFRQGGGALTVFKDLSLHLDAGEIVSLVGQSGSGKSTLLQIAGLLDTPSAGDVVIKGRSVVAMSEKERTQMRGHSIGFVYQFHHLLPEFTALENVAMGAIIAGVHRKDALAKAAKLLKDMGLQKRAEHRPAQMSGGEQQRVAIARALVNDPALILADEPTGNLDPETSAFVFDILLNQVRQRQMGALIATHNHDLAGKMDRHLELKSGRII